MCKLWARNTSTLYMKYSYVIFGVVLLAVFGAFFAYQNTDDMYRIDEEIENAQEQSAPQGKLMSIESYVTQNISLLSPEKEVLGGTFYVTKIEVEPEEKKGYVEYEDGHVAYSADFTYTADDMDGINITSFVVRH